MKSYIQYSEALELLNPERCEELFTEEAGCLLDRSVERGVVFSIIKDGKILMQKKSFAKYFGNLGVLKDGISFEQDDSIEKAQTSYRHISTLKARLNTDTCIEYYDCLRIDDIYADYHIDEFSILELKKSLVEEGLYGILGGTCGYIDCCGRFVQVEHFSEDVITWTNFHFRKDPVIGLEGYLFQEEDFEEFERLIASPNIEGLSRELDDMKKFKASKVLIVPPIYFSRTQLEELTEGY